MTIMSIAELLSRTIAPDEAVRLDAEKQLSSLSQESFPQYMGMLCQELANEQNQIMIRQAAGLAFKNALTAKDTTTKSGFFQRWLATDAGFRAQIKTALVGSLASSSPVAGQVAAQAVAAVAEIELPQSQWDELIPCLKANVSEPSEHTREATLQSLGYICETIDPDLLANQANDILTAVTKGAHKEEPSKRVRIAAIKALTNSLDFVRTNFERDGDRNYIMIVVCEAAVAPDEEIQVAAFECLVKIVQIYYSKMMVYMKEALFSLTVQAMKSPFEKVALQAIEFWSTVCEEEAVIISENRMLPTGQKPSDLFGFARSASRELVPILLFLLTKKEEDDDEDEWNVPMAAATCLSLLATVLENDVVPLVIPWVEQNINSADWHYREAAVMAFGSILDGPHPDSVAALFEFSLPFFINMMSDPQIQVKDTTAWTLGRISELLSPATVKPDHLRALIAAVIEGLSSHPKVASNCAWCIINLADHMCEDPEAQTYKLSEYFQILISSLLSCVQDKPDQDTNLKATVYEAVATLVSSCAKDCFPIVEQLCVEMVRRLQATIEMQRELVNSDDRTALQELQGNICGVLTNIVRRFSKQIAPMADQLMLTLLHILTSASRSSTVLEDVFIVVSALASAIEGDFYRYMQDFNPHLKRSLEYPQDHQLTAIAIGLIGDICRALNERVAEFCEEYMHGLLFNLNSPILDANVKPAILSCFGDIAIAIGGNFDRYTNDVMVIIDEVISKISMEITTQDQLDYVNLMREGIMEAYVGITQGLTAGNKAMILRPHLDKMFVFMQFVQQDEYHTEELTTAMAGLIGDIAEAFPENSLKAFYVTEWVDRLQRELKGMNQKNPSAKTQELLKWVRLGVKKQKGVRG